MNSQRGARSQRFVHWQSTARLSGRKRGRAVIAITLFAHGAFALTVGAQASVPTTASAPERHAARLVLPTSDASDWERLRQLEGDTASLTSYLLRSPSLTMFSRGDSARRSTFQVLAPTLQLRANSAIPFSQNDGAMWAGRGVSFRVNGGAAYQRGRLRVVFAPELWATSNADFSRDRDPNKFISPIIPEVRWGNGYADPWYVRPYSADLPWRFGHTPFGRLTPGQSGVWVNAGPVELGATSENTWWGPGVRNAILLSDNAAGIPRLELRSPHPLRTRAGELEWRWFVGALSESQYFDTTKANDVRSVAAAAVAWRPAFAPTLTVGAARSVYGTASGYGVVPLRWLTVFRGTGHPAARPLSDSTLTPGGYDQLFSLFARWVFPADGFEAYTEWARQELPVSLHDFLASPSQSHGYTLGLQYRKPAPLDAATLRVQAEITTLEQSETIADRPVGVFYTSRRVIQGYTQLGQPLGAAIGPGSSSQWIAIDRVSPRGAIGVTFNRIRWNEDVRSTYSWPAYLGYCNHDVSILPGIRGGHALGGGYLSGELVVGTRLNAFFQNQSGCPTGGPSKIDEHNTTLSISFTPFAL